jgi:hypothetical protein
VLILCALVPIVSAVTASAISVRVKGTGKILSLGCGTLILGALLTAILIFAAAV